jgi:Homeodomain-like domain
MSVQCGDRIEMSQRERDRLKVLHCVKEGGYTQAKAAQLLGLTVRQVRRLQERLPERGDEASENRRGEMYADISNDRKMRTFQLHYAREKTLTIPLGCVAIGKNSPMGAVIGPRRGDIGQPAR